MKTTSDVYRPQLSFGRTTKTLATMALICGLSMSARAQLGSGWSPDNETYIPQTSAGTSITAISGGFEFSTPSGLGRAEMRGNNLPTNVTNQWQGFATLRAFPSGSNNICMHQVFGPEPSTPDLILDEAVGGPTGIELMSLEQGNAFEAAIQVGVQFQLNTIYDPVGNLITIYVNGSKTGTKVPNAGVHYNKFGQYVSLSGSGPSKVDWVNVQSWAGGKAPGSSGGGTPAPVPSPAPTPAPGGSVTAVALRALVNNMYVSADNYGNNPLIANRTTASTWETFDEIDMGNGNIALRAHVNNKYVCADNAGTSPLIANRTSVGSWETYHKEAVPGGYALKSLANNMYVCADNYGNNPLIANRTSPSTWETFVFVNE
jgi:hypothetical protein